MKALIITFVCVVSLSFLAVGCSAQSGSANETLSNENEKENIADIGQEKQAVLNVNQGGNNTKVYYDQELDDLLKEIE